MKYQILKNNQLLSITEDEFEFCKKRDTDHFGGAYIYLSDDREIMTLIPYANLRQSRQVTMADHQNSMLENIRIEKMIEENYKLLSQPLFIAGYPDINNIDK
jgi:hypothetical protein